MKFFGIRAYGLYGERKKKCWGYFCILDKKDPSFRSGFFTEKYLKTIGAPNIYLACKSMADLHLSYIKKTKRDRKYDGSVSLPINQMTLHTCVSIDKIEIFSMEMTK